MDCWDYNTENDYARVMASRNLSFRASAPVTRDEAIEIFKQAVPHNYNEFRADCLQELPATCFVTIGREGSVCVYVTNGQVTGRMKEAMLADELHKHIDGWRLWWD